MYLNEFMKLPESGTLQDKVSDVTVTSLNFKIILYSSLKLQLTIIPEFHFPSKQTQPTKPS